MDHVLLIIQIFKTNSNVLNIWIHRITFELKVCNDCTFCLTDPPRSKSPRWGRASPVRTQHIAKVSTAHNFILLSRLPCNKHSFCQTRFIFIAGCTLKDSSKSTGFMQPIQLFWRKYNNNRQFSPDFEFCPKMKRNETLKPNLLRPLQFDPLKFKK